MQLAVAKLQALRLFSIETTGTAAAEDSELITGFVDSANAIDALGNSQSGTFSWLQVSRAVPPTTKAELFFPSKRGAVSLRCACGWSWS